MRTQLQTLPLKQGQFHNLVIIFYPLEDASHEEDEPSASSSTKEKKALKRKNNAKGSIPLCVSPKVPTPKLSRMSGAIKPTL